MAGRRLRHLTHCGRIPNLPTRSTLRRLKGAGLVDCWSHAVAAPSRGLHLYFAGTDQPSSSIPAHGIDFRGLGGYVLVSPSRVHLNGIRGEYRTIDLRDSSRAKEVDWKAIRAHLTPTRALPPVQATTRGHGDADRR